MCDQWGPWIQHDGRGCPLPNGTIVELMTADGERCVGIIDKSASRGVDVWDWSVCAFFSKWNWRLIRYRVRKPRGLTILESLLADLPEKVDA